MWGGEQPEEFGKEYVLFVVHVDEGEGVVNFFFKRDKTLIALDSYQYMFPNGAF